MDFFNAREFANSICNNRNGMKVIKKRKWRYLVEEYLVLNKITPEAVAPVSWSVGEFKQRMFISRYLYWVIILEYVS